MTLSDSRSEPTRQARRRGRYPRPGRVSPDYPHHHSSVPCPLPRRIERVRSSISSPPVLPSPLFRRVGIRIITFEACSGFTRYGPLAKPLVSYQTYRQLSGWNLSPLALRAVGAH
jgi:hypothetical protein